MDETDIGREFKCVHCGTQHRAARGPVPMVALCRPCRWKAKQSGENRPAFNAYCRELRDRKRLARVCAECQSRPPMKSGKYCSSACRMSAINRAGRVGVERTGQCGHCQSPFVTIRPNQRYCSRRCKDKINSRRPSEARPLYRYARWLHLRKAQLSAEPTCRFCALVGIETAATVCDHVYPHRGNVEAFWSGPFQSLCTECHNRDKQRMERSAA